MPEELRFKNKAEAIQAILGLDFYDYSNNFIKIVDKNTNTVSLQLNDIQQIIDDNISELEKKHKPVRIIILKARQTGVSTYTQAKILRKTTENFNKTALVVAHTDKATNSIFNKAKFMYENLNPLIKPVKKASNAQELIFDKPINSQVSTIGLNSRFKVATAGGSGIGRADTHHYVHLSELAFYEGNIKEIYNGIMASIPAIPGTYVIIESTANGFNFYKSMWDSAVNGENEYVPLFFSWMNHKEYSMPVTEEEENEIKASLTKYEKELIDTYEVNASQIKWYRWTLANNCAGDTDLMKQEFPSFPSEAFLHTGRPVFDVEKLQRRLDELEELYKQRPYDIGYIEYDEKNDKYTFVKDVKGNLKIFKHPECGRPYVMGGDIAEGITGGDWTVSSVGDNITGEQVAVQRLHTEPDLFALEQIKLAKYYNNALIADEVNNHGLTTIKELQKHGYQHQYKREVFDEITKKKEDKFGFHTTQATRPKVIDTLRAIVRDNVELINDPTTIMEMQSFVFKDNGRAEGETGTFDDCVIACALMYEARAQQRAYMPQTVPKLPENVHYSVYEDIIKNPQLKRWFKKKQEKTHIKLGGWNGK